MLVELEALKKQLDDLTVRVESLERLHEYLDYGENLFTPEAILDAEDSFGDSPIQLHVED